MIEAVQCMALERNIYGIEEVWQNFRLETAEFAVLVNYEPVQIARNNTEVAAALNKGRKAKLVTSSVVNMANLDGISCVTHSAFIFV